MVYMLLTYHKDPVYHFNSLLEVIADPMKAFPFSSYNLKGHVQRQRGYNTILVG